MQLKILLYENEKTYFYFISIIIFSYFGGCNEKNVLIENRPVPWEQKIQRLNERYASIKIGKECPVIFRAAQSTTADNDSTSSTNTDRNRTTLVVASDIIGGSLGALTGTWLGIAGGAILGSFLASEVGSTDTSVPAYNNSINGPESIGNFTSIDLRDPINPLYDLQPLNDAIGINIGMYHNFVLTQMLIDENYSCHSSDPAIVTDMIFQVMEDYNVMGINQISSSEKNWIMHSLSQQDYFVENIDEARQEMTAYHECIREYFDIALYLDYTALYEYTNQYTTIINEAWMNNELSIDEAFLINGCVSVGFYSRQLWRSYLPSPLLSKYRIIYIEQSNTIICCSKEHMMMLLQAGTIYGPIMIGIPHFVNGIITEVYFYRNGMEGYCELLNNVEERVISVNNETTYILSDVNINIPCSELFPIGEYILTEVPESDQEIYYITLY